jgi:EAL domain-containing protein (putative c-di-GMP-specific phosphodiesterase class I)
VDPHSLKLEITESMVMENIEAAIEMLQQLRKLGIELSIDDFGTGYSSLSYLHRFPISTVKIDQYFVGRMDTSDECHEIVRTIVGLAHALDMDVVAEGVETARQVELLRALGSEYVQGYLLSRPVPSQGLEAVLREEAVLVPLPAGSAAEPAQWAGALAARRV